MMEVDKLAALAKDQKDQEYHHTRVQWRVQRQNARIDIKKSRAALEDLALSSFADMQNALVENDVVTALKCMKKLNIHPIDVDAEFLQEVRPLPNDVLTRLLRTRIVIVPTGKDRKRGWQPGTIPYEDDAPYGGDVDIDSNTDTSAYGEKLPSYQKDLTRERWQVYKRGVKYWNRAAANTQQRLDMIAACNFTCPMCKRVELNQHAWVAHYIKQGLNSSGPSKVCVCMRCYGDWLKKYMPKQNKKPPFRPKGGDPPADGVCPTCKKITNTARRFWRTTQDPVVCWRCGDKQSRTTASVPKPVKKTPNTFDIVKILEAVNFTCARCNKRYDDVTRWDKTMSPPMCKFCAKSTRERQRVDFRAVLASVSCVCSQCKKMHTRMSSWVVGSSPPMCKGCSNGD